MNKIYFDHSFTIPHIYDTNILILKNNFTFQKMAFSFKEKCIHSEKKHFWGYPFSPYATFSEKLIIIYPDTQKQARKWYIRKSNNKVDSITVGGIVIGYLLP